jgi:hypothetical protein
MTIGGQIALVAWPWGRRLVASMRMATAVPMAPYITFTMAHILADMPWRSTSVTPIGHTTDTRHIVSFPEPMPATDIGVLDAVGTAARIRTTKSA